MGQSMPTESFQWSRGQKPTCTKCLFASEILLQESACTQHPMETMDTNLSPFPISHSLNSSFLGKNIYKHLDTLRAVTQCYFKDGQATFSWLDRWLLPERLATAYPALFSHHQTQHGIVSDILQEGVQNVLQNRLTNAAQNLPHFYLFCRFFTYQRAVIQGR
jgi:hypothetical protein